ncbi:MAG: hypothetical protein IAF08_04480 [Rhizobacter sp.]|nr:hypothetical protein [Chlorobiales bacterium]
MIYLSKPLGCLCTVKIGNGFTYLCVFDPDAAQCGSMQLDATLQGRDDIRSNHL